MRFQRLSCKACSITLSGSAGSIAGAGTILLSPRTAARPVVIGAVQGASCFGPAYEFLFILETELRRRKMKLKDLHHYDTYVPILSERQIKHTWDQAVKLVIGSLHPLGSDYCGALEKGLNNGWCDRYPNRGKQSGAFSSGSFDGEPYILMNYQPEVLDHVFTLAHEAGHSMHTHLAAKHQPYQYYDYTIFVAEVASTFNEQLLSRYMMQRAKSGKQRAYLINREIDSIRGTIIRQTMFAEFEKIAHHSAKGMMFALPVAASQPKRLPIPWDASAPYKGLGFRGIEGQRSPVK